MILAGDIGGTKTRLALFDWKDERVEAQTEQVYISTDYTSFEDILSEFLNPPQPEPVESSEPDELSLHALPSLPEAQLKELLKIDAACIGVAGPVIENRCQTTNLPWLLDGDALAKRFDIPTVRLLNDLEATAHGLLELRPGETTALNAGTVPSHKRPIALIAAGTGLGEAILYWDGMEYRPMPSEGGHADFAPNSDLEIDLLRHLRASYLHVSWERVLSGPGLHAIYEFLRDTKRNEPTWMAERIQVEDPAAVIAEVGLKKQADIGVQALDLFASIYGAEAGNLALKSMSLSGVYLGGGIAPKLLAKLQDGSFMRGFTNKGRYKKLMSSIPVRVIVNDRAGLIGAASVAAKLAKQEC
ncbi:MAG: glucokinase [Nitrospirota bacterium]|nr:glucokinase [Nitrospirota bacterium]